MTTREPIIDPALRDLQPRKQPAGVKRKTRTSVAPIVAPAQPSGGRVTRRQSNAATATATTPVVSSPTAASKPRRGRAAHPSIPEPSRGEEENLIKYEWTRHSNTKRQRHRSPSAHAQGTPNAWAGETLKDSTHASPTLEGIENLAAAAAFQSEPPRPIFPYPFGLTPFRYPCHRPHSPPPPPGDPRDPNFRPYDPTFSTIPQTSDYIGEHQPKDMPHPSPRGMSRLPSSGLAEYASLSSLLAASEAQFSGSPVGRNAE